VSVPFDSPSVAAPVRTSDAQERLYAMVWRWHFFAALFVVPFALLLAATGGVYLFKPQIEEWLYAGLYNVPHASGSVDADAQLGAALAKFPGFKTVAYTPPPGDTRSALVRLQEAEGKQITVAIDPRSGTVLGVIDEQHRAMQIVRDLHGKLLFGKAGQAIQELAASWAMVLLITGLYMWWPRRGSALRGTVVPRLATQGRTFWRDLHAVTGFWVSALLVFLVATGLPWSLVSGKVLNEIAGHVGKGNPEIGVGWDGGGSTVVKSNPPGQGWAVDHAQHLAGAGHSHAAAGAAPLALARVVEIARTLPGIAPGFEIRFPVDAQGVFSVVTDSETDPEATAYVHLDQYTGAVVSDVRWPDFGPLSKAIALGVSLHEGRYFGLPNQLLGLAACVGLVALVTAGIVMWWRRRPAGSLGAPPAPKDFRVGPGILALAILLGLIMPLMAASLVLVLGIDWGANRWLRKAVAT